MASLSLDDGRNALVWSIEEANSILGQWGNWLPGEHSNSIVSVDVLLSDGTWQHQEGELEMFAIPTRIGSLPVIGSVDEMLNFCMLQCGKSHAKQRGVYTPVVFAYAGIITRLEFLRLSGADMAANALQRMRDHYREHTPLVGEKSRRDAPEYRDSAAEGLWLLRQLVKNIKTAGEYGRED